MEQLNRLLAKGAYDSFPQIKVYQELPTFPPEFDNLGPDEQQLIIGKYDGIDDYIEKRIRAVLKEVKREEKQSQK